MNPNPLRYAISDRNLARDSGCEPPVEQARRLAAKGVNFYQLREKDLSAADLAELARGVLRSLANTETRLLINGRVDVAAAIGAHGVHLTASPDELTTRQAHRVYRSAGRAAPVVTISCHSLADVARVRDEQPNAILFGPVFGKTVAGERVVEGLGLALLRDASRVAAPIPVLALGGVTDRNTAACLEAGAAGIAGIRLFQQAPKGGPFSRRGLP